MGTIESQLDDFIEGKTNTIRSSVKNLFRLAAKEEIKKELKMTLMALGQFCVQLCYTLQKTGKFVISHFFLMERNSSENGHFEISLCPRCL